LQSCTKVKKLIFIVANETKQFDMLKNETNLML